MTTLPNSSHSSSTKKTSDCIGIRLLRREILELEIRDDKCVDKENPTQKEYQNRLKLREKIKELESLGYVHIPNWIE